MLDEESKAIQEVAKTAGKSVDLVHKTGQTTMHIFGDALRAFGGATADWARYYRLKNWLSINDKVHATIEARRLAGKTNPIPPQYALPIFDAASLESEEDIQELWANLIANAIDPACEFYVRKVFVETLRALEPIDAKILLFLASPHVDERYGTLVEGTLNAEELAMQLSFGEEATKVSLQALARYGCILDSWEQSLESLDYGYGGFRVSNPKSNFRLSHFGRELVKGAGERGA